MESAHERGQLECVVFGKRYFVQEVIRLVCKRYRDRASRPELF